MTSYGTRSRGISRDIYVSASDVTYPPAAPLPRNVVVNNLPCNNMERWVFCGSVPWPLLYNGSVNDLNNRAAVFCGVRAKGLSWRQLVRPRQWAVNGRQSPTECQTLRADRMEYWRVRIVSCVMCNSVIITCSYHVWNCNKTHLRI
jgi:hypothetical protein